MKHIAAVGIVFCLLGCLAIACQSPSPTAISAPPPTIPPISAPTQTSTPRPGPLTDAEAIALIEEEATARGVSPDTLRITMRGEPRSASIRYSSHYKVDSNVFQVQMMFVALTAAQAMARVQPPIKGGMRLAVVPGGEGEVGLRVTFIDWVSLEAWATGSISDQEFMSQWTKGAVTRE
jgi:hypothetical protein